MKKIPEKWAFLITEDTVELANKLRLSICTSHKDAKVSADQWLVSRHVSDGSCYWSNDQLPSSFDHYTRLPKSDFIQIAKMIMNLPESVTASNNTRILLLL